MKVTYHEQRIQQGWPYALSSNKMFVVSGVGLDIPHLLYTKSDQENTKHLRIQRLILEPNVEYCVTMTTLMCWVVPHNSGARIWPALFWSYILFSSLPRALESYPFTHEDIYWCSCNPLNIIHMNAKT